MAIRIKPMNQGFFSRISQALRSSEETEEREADQMEREEEQEEKEEKAVVQQEKRKENLTKGELKLVKSAMLDLNLAMARLKTGGITAAYSRVNKALNSVIMLTRSINMKSQLTRMEEQEMMRDARLTQTEEAQTIREKRATKARKVAKKRKR